MDNVRHIRERRDQQVADENPGSALGTALLALSNSPEFLVVQLRGYLAAAEADLAEERATSVAAMAAMGLPPYPSTEPAPAAQPCRVTLQRQRHGRRSYGYTLCVNGTEIARMSDRLGDTRTLAEDYAKVLRAAGQDVTVEELPQK